MTVQETSDAFAEPVLNRRDLFAATATGVVVSGAIGVTATAQESASAGGKEMASATAEDYERDPTRWGSPAVAALFPSLVFGASGSGKSSLVKAGLLPDLMLPGMVGHVALVRYAILLPSPELGALPLGDTVETLAALLREAPGQAARPIRQGLVAAGRAAGLGGSGEARLLVVVDQLEELFTQERLLEAERAAFVAALDALAKSGVVWVIATMRSDFFDRLETTPALASLSAGEARFLLLPPDAAEIGQIIRQPAQESGLRFEIRSSDGLALADIIRQATISAKGALPLLSFLLDQLWLRRSETGLLTFAAYEELGGLEGAVGRRAEDVFLAQPEKARAELVSLLRALVTVKDGKVTSRSAPLSMFPAGSPPRALADAFCDPSARLLVADRDSGGAHLRLAHEALLTHWPTARDQVAADARDLELRGRLEEEAKRWRMASRPDKPSLVRAPGLPLAEALALCGRWGAMLPPKVTEFVTSSRRAARRRRLVATLAGAVVALPVIALFVWGALVWSGVRSVEAEMEVENKFVPVPPGCFQMGSSDSEEGRRTNEGPVHEVCLKAFALGRFEVTQGQWRKVMVQNPDPSYFKDDDRRPVENVSWSEA